MTRRCSSSGGAAGENRHRFYRLRCHPSLETLTDGGALSCRLEQKEDSVARRSTSATCVAVSHVTLSDRRRRPRRGQSEATTSKATGRVAVAGEAKSAAAAVVEAKEEGVGREAEVVVVAAAAALRVEDWEAEAVEKVEVGAEAEAEAEAGAEETRPQQLEATRSSRAR